LNVERENVFLRFVRPSKHWHRLMLQKWKKKEVLGKDRLMSKKRKKKEVFGKFRMYSGVLRVAGGGSGAKAPPLAARPPSSTSGENPFRPPTHDLPLKLPHVSQVFLQQLANPHVIQAG